MPSVRKVVMRLWSLNLEFYDILTCDIILGLFPRTKSRIFPSLVGDSYKVDKKLVTHHPKESLDLPIDLVISFRTIPLRPLYCREVKVSKVEEVHILPMSLREEDGFIYLSGSFSPLLSRGVRWSVDPYYQGV
jgi:hypothetical protein